MLEHRALTYGMTGREPMGKGPVVVLLDESSSMRADGRDIWSKAVALALLSTATKEKRPWHLVAFNAGIRREVAIEAGNATVADVSGALDYACRGGTNFDIPVSRACGIIRTSRTMRRADVVMITDGEEVLGEAAVEEANELTQVEGVSWFVVGVGVGAAVSKSLAPIATEIFTVKQLTEASTAAPIVNLERKEVA